MLSRSLGAAPLYGLDQPLVLEQLDGVPHDLGRRADHPADEMTDGHRQGAVSHRAQRQAAERAEAGGLLWRQRVVSEHCLAPWPDLPAMMAERRRKVYIPAAVMLPPSGPAGAKRPSSPRSGDPCPRPCAAASG